MVAMWYFHPHTGGKKIPPLVQERIRRRILTYAEAKYRGRYTRLDIRFRGALCYIDAYIDPGDPYPTHLCRIRYFGDDNRWSLAFYTYSHEKYEPCVFMNGDWMGTPEEAFDVGAVYLQG
jgi:hypothetical protein